jgi:hypothetical protein
MNFYSELNVNDSTLLPRKIRDHVLFREKIVKPVLSNFSTSVQRSRHSSPFSNNSKIKEILEMIQARKSGLEKYKIPKISTNKIIQKHTKNESWFNSKKYCLLPKIKSPSVEVEMTDRSLPGEKCEDILLSYGKMRTERRIVLSKISTQSFNLLNNNP